ncbi:MAG: cell division protein FtsB [Candidatus Azotimanducaceae bacterium]|jgi:cell division protein FtsB
MISGDIDLDKLLEDIEQQVEILSAIAADNAILNEQLRLLQATRDALIGQELEISRLAEMIDPDNDMDFSTLMELRQQSED